MDPERAKDGCQQYGSLHIPFLSLWQSSIRSDSDPLDKIKPPSLVRIKPRSAQLKDWLNTEYRHERIALGLPRQGIHTSVNRTDGWLVTDDQAKENAS
jgi:hypothetical protein